jgi:lipoprotein-anchoring transpeptidase ErfK/SrfK
LSKPAASPSYRIRIGLAEQRLDLLRGRELARSYPVSTSKHGAGELKGTFKTPRGRHVIRAKIGAGQPIGAVFRGRRPTGEIYSEELAREHPGRDWILTRILWLSGTEVGKNRLGDVDTMRRYIYIHGTPDSTPLGVPGSIGCVRMANAAIIELFDVVPPGTVVEIA